MARVIFYLPPRTLAVPILHATWLFGSGLMATPFLRLPSCQGASCLCRSWLCALDEQVSMDIIGSVNCEPPFRGLNQSCHGALEDATLPESGAKEH